MRGQLFSERLEDAGQLHFADRLFAMDELIGLFEEIGYKLVDRSENMEDRCTIPFRSQHSLEGDYGLFFSRVEDA